MQKNYLRGKVICLTGAAGSIGSTLARRIAEQKPSKLILLDQDETGIFDLEEEIPNSIGVVMNIRDYMPILKIFKKYRPDYVFHAAAMKHVVMCERYPDQAMLTNINGLRCVLDASCAVNVKKFIFISSDKAVNPTSVMGETKKGGEVLCRFYKDRLNTIIVRFGNVMPSRGSIIPIFNKLISQGKDLTVTHPKMERYFMGIYQAVDLILSAAQLGKSGSTFIMDMGKPVLIKDLADMMIKISGKPLKVVYTRPQAGEKFTEQLMTKEERKYAKRVDGLFIIK